jgi:hypothetical protein
MAEGANMQYLIIATGIMAGSRAFFNKRPSVSRQVKDFFASFYRIGGGRDGFIYLPGAFCDFSGYTQTQTDGLCRRVVGDLFVDEEL